VVEELAEEVAQTAEESREIVRPASIDELEPKVRVQGSVERLELYGAFVNIGLDASAILHISKLDKKVNRISDALTVGQEVTAWVETVDPERKQVTLTMREPLSVEWSDLKPGQSYQGTVTRLEKYGVFVDIGAEKEGLVHISELSHDYVNHPGEVVKVGDEVDVQVLGFNKRKRRIDLSRKALLETAEAARAEVEAVEEELVDVQLPTAMEIALRRAMGETVEEIERQARRGKSKRRARGSRRLQEDIISRTLKLSRQAEND
jgi:small subunit ribosomal protein S1